MSTLIDKPPFPLVSIIMPVYNAGLFIRAALDSVLAQSYDHWELIIINDGSTDDGKAVVATFTDSRIRFYEQANRGASAARNLGLREMRGDYFCFLDADDVMPRDGLRERLAVFERFPQASFVDGAVLVMDAQLSVITRVWTPQGFGSPLNDLVTLGGKCFFGLTWMVKRLPHHVYEMREGLSHSEDLLFFLTLSRHGGTYAHTTEPVLKYRNVAHSAMKNIAGLERGYRKVYEAIKTWNEINHRQLRTYRKKTRRIMVLSYLRNFQWAAAVRIVFQWL